MNRVGLVGTRLALVGAVLYLLEWAVIPFFPDVPTDRLGDGATEIVAAYADEAGMVAFGAGWLSLVLVGRVLYAGAVRSALRSSGHPSALADFAVGAMAVSVAIEVASFGITASAAWLADNGADASAIVALDSAGSVVFGLVFTPLALSVLALSWAMLESGLFRRWLCWLGIVAGVLGTVGGVLEPLRLGSTGLGDAAQIPLNLGVLGFWIWMVVTAVVLWRAAPRKAEAT